MKVSDKTYRELQALILSSEGKTLEDEVLPGCRIKDSEGRKGYLNYYLGKGMWEWLASPLPARWINNINNLEILGLPIDLSRILKALGKSNKRKIAIGMNGELLSHDYEDGWLVEEFEFWNLDLPAHLQEEEVILKLNEILR